MERNVDLSSVLKANDYSDPRKADLLVSISTVDAVAPIIHLLFHCKIIVYHLSSPGGHNYCGIHSIDYFSFQMPRLKLTDTTLQGHGKRTYVLCCFRNKPLRKKMLLIFQYLKLSFFLLLWEESRWRDCMYFLISIVWSWVRLPNTHLTWVRNKAIANSLQILLLWQPSKIKMKRIHYVLLLLYKSVCSLLLNAFS